MPLLDFISTRQAFAAAAVVVYASVAMREPGLAATTLWAAALLGAVLFVLQNRVIPIRVAVTVVAYFAFIAGRLEMRRIVIASAVAVWVVASTYFTGRLEKFGRKVAAKVFGVAADLWLIAMLTLLSLEGYIVTGLLLISVASWIPRAGKMKLWFVLGYALLGGWLIIAAHLDINLELRRWYLLGALAVGIGASLLASAQEVQQREDVHPQ